MAAKSRTAARVLLLTGLALVVFGGYTAVIEARPFLDAGITTAARYTNLEEGRARFGLSSVSQRVVLDNCFDAMLSLYGRTQPRARGLLVWTACRDFGDRVVAEIPTQSFAWYLGALASARLGDTDGMNERLAQSQTTGPFEQWIAELRVNLAEDHFAELDATVLEQHDRDLALLAQSERGVASIADRYVREESFRSRILAVVEKLPNSAQRNFVNMVEIATQREVRRLGG